MGKTTGFLTKSLTATTAIPAHTLVKYGAADGTCVPAVDATAFIFGVAHEIDTAVGERCSVHGPGNIAPVIYGATVARGDPLTANASSQAIKATAAGQFVVGFAEVSGVAGQIGTVTVAPFVY